MHGQLNCEAPKLWMVLPILFLLFGCAAKNDFDKAALAIELDSIYTIDQKYRKEIQKVQEEYGWDALEAKELWDKQFKIDRSNLKRIIAIIKEVGGYPGKTLVGETASKATFYVLQHADDSTQAKYYQLIIDAAGANELDKRLAAMYQDRYLMHKGESQIFGTQIMSQFEIDSITGERSTRTFVWPIADTTRIDSLRLINGLGNLEEYLNKFDVSRWN